MPRYFFDTWDGQLFVKDEYGVDLLSIEEVRDMAAEALADIARDALPGSVRRELAVEVDDEQHRRVLRASIWFEVVLLA